MIVCICQGVSDREIRAWSELEGGDFEALQRDLGVSTRCGDCRHCACDVLAQCAARAAERAAVVQRHPTGS